jgi:hypothetical protein
MPLKVDLDTNFFKYRSCNNSKMADVTISEVGAKLAPVNVGPRNFVF